MKKETINKFYQTYRLIIFPIVIILSNFILIFFIIYPQTVKLISDNKQEAELKSKHQFLEAKASQLENYSEEDLSRKVRFALYSLPAEADFAFIIGLLQKLTNELGFNILSLNLSQRSDAKAQTQSYVVQLELSGAKTLLSSLINNIENYVRIMRVSNIEISASSRDLNSLNANLEIEVFFSNVSANLGSIDSPLPEISTKDEQLLEKLAASVPSQEPIRAAPVGPRGKANPFE